MAKKIEPPADEEAVMTLSKAASDELMEKIVCLCGDYANHVLTPRILAERRRRRGDNSASPRDYDCRCEFSRDDELPICEALREACKFAHRTPPPPPRYRDNHVWWTVHTTERERILKNLLWHDEAAFLAEIRLMEAALEKEDARLVRSRGRGIKRAKTAWSA